MVKPVARTQNDLYKPVAKSQDQQSQWLGRKITMPSSHAQGAVTVVKSKQGIGCLGITCVIAIVCIIAGAGMWAACEDDSSAGCSPAIKISGKVLAGSGIGIISLMCCALCCLGCLVGIGKAMQS
jgi:hypothetical protein